MTKRKGYQIDLRPPHDGQITKRNRLGRLLSFIASSALLVVTPIAFVGYWGKLLGYEAAGLLIGFCIGGALEAWLAPRRMFIYNPEWTAYVTQDVFAGTMIPYGPGFHLSHWWEERNKRGNYSLKVITRDFKASVATQTAKVVVSGQYGYAIDLELITRAIGVDETTIENGITAFIESFLTSRCADESADKVRGMIDDLNGLLASEFMEKDGEEDLKSFGDQYGFITVSVIINNIMLPEAAQKTRDAIDEAASLNSVVAKMYGLTPEELAAQLKSKIISMKDFNTMLNRALAASDNAKMDIKIIEADIPALVGKIVEQFSGEKGGKS